MSKQEYQQQGYTVYHNHIDTDTAELVCQSVIGEVCDLVFKNETNKPDPTDPNTLNLFTDFNLRKKKLDNPKCVWRDGNTRRPIISKSTGMVNISFNHDVQRYVTFNPNTISKINELYGSDKLVYTYGSDRVCIKAKGSTNMNKHLDYHLNSTQLQKEPTRVQALVCGRCPTDVPVQHSGTLEVIPYFHLYWECAQAFFVSPFGKIKIHQSVPQTLYKDFDQKLPLFNVFLQRLHYIRDNNIPINDAWKPYQHLMNTLPPTYHEIKWTPILLRTGDMVCWTQKLPHRSLQNKSTTARIVFYVRLFTVDENWFGTPHQQQVAHNVTNGIVTGNHANELERQLRPPDYSWLYDNDIKTQRLCGLAPYEF